MKQADIDNSGTIDYGEFIAATVHLNKLEREENLLSAFSYFDKDGSGYITIDEIQQACKEFGLDDVHIDEMVKEIDQDNVSIFLFCYYKFACNEHKFMQLIFVDYMAALALLCLSLKDYNPISCQVVYWD